MYNAENPLQIAILDLYEGQPNEGMRCLRDIISQFGQTHQIPLTLQEYDVRLKKEVPALEADVYISSGGPGSPLDSEGSDWEQIYFSWFQKVWEWNATPGNKPKKVFFICHSFQLICRFLQLAEVCKRRSTAFGIFPVHMLEAGASEPIFKGLADPFYVVDSRDYQVIRPNPRRMDEMGAKILAIEKERPHVPLERAVMAMRFNTHMVGTQFHPEADAVGMSMYLRREDKKQTIISNHGEEKWQNMLDHLEDPDKILLTYSTVLNNFLSDATRILQA